MNFEYSDKTKDMVARVRAFMDKHVYPNENTYWEQLAAAKDRWDELPIVEELKPKAQSIRLGRLGWVLSTSCGSAVQTA